MRKEEVVRCQTEPLVLNLLLAKRITSKSPPRDDSQLAFLSRTFLLLSARSNYSTAAQLYGGSRPIKPKPVDTGIHRSVHTDSPFL